MDWKEKLNQLKDSLPQDNSEPTENELPEKKVQTEPLRVQMEKRNGKPVTIVSEFEGNEKELKELAKTLKVSCSAGGTAE
ncbi:MAG: translation initiation factor, partial [Paludibacteraceae bacterium]|nr:translation initiation factor [Paludibacteraceae bacterium]